MKRALLIILALGLAGLIFSGVLSYREVFVNPAGPTCPTVGRPGTVLGHPACVYGFFMYLGVVGVAAAGLFGSGHAKAGEAESPREQRPEVRPPPAESPRQA